MSEETAADMGGTMHENGMGPLRPLSVRMSDGTRAQLEILAQLNERSLTEETRLALEHWVEKSKSDPAVLRRAEQVRAEVEEPALVATALPELADPRRLENARVGAGEAAGDLVLHVGESGEQRRGIVDGAGHLVLDRGDGREQRIQGDVP